MWPLPVHDASGPFSPTALKETICATIAVVGPILFEAVEACNTGNAAAVKSNAPTSANVTTLPTTTTNTGSSSNGDVKSYGDLIDTLVQSQCFPVTNAAGTRIGNLWRCFNHDHPWIEQLMVEASSMIFQLMLSPPPHLYPVGLSRLEKDRRELVKPCLIYTLCLTCGRCLQGLSLRLKLS